MVVSASDFGNAIKILFAERRLQASRRSRFFFKPLRK